MARSHYSTKKRQKELDRKKKQEEKMYRKQAKKRAEVVESEMIQPDENESLSS